jgi:salicylate hydroxylase
VTRRALIAGGGIGGLAAAIACQHAGWQASIHEQAAHLSEVGAGLQLGPNATRLLRGWGLEKALRRAAAIPRELQVRNAADDRVLGRMPLGQRCLAHYGAPYFALHRADLQAVLLEAAREAGAELTLASCISQVNSSGAGVRAQLGAHDWTLSDNGLLLGADGLWSRVRDEVWNDGPPLATGHVAYRALLPQRQLPERLRSQDVTLWLGPGLHAVRYPVRGGDMLNIVFIVEGRGEGDARDWNQPGAMPVLSAALSGVGPALRDAIEAVPAWRAWSLHDRRPMQGPGDMALGRVALLGDAAHPMRPYFAQGAAMAIEDAAALGHALEETGELQKDVAPALQRYAMARWQRGATVQARSRRNGQIFHATGAMRWARDVALRLAGERLLDQPWLYAR